MKHILTSLRFLCTALLLAGCLAPEPAPEAIPEAIFTATSFPSATPAPTATATPPDLSPTQTPLPSATPTNAEALPGYGFGPSNFPGDINPLTGLRVSNLNLLERRPIAVKITNFPRQVRPQWGLTRADHIYEYFIGDQMTRFAAVFYGQAVDRAGPVRSARYFDAQLILMYKAILAFGYADAPIIGYLNDLKLSNFMLYEHPDNCPPICRIGPDNDYNNMYVDTTQAGPYMTAAKGTSNERQNLDGLRFEAQSLITVGGGAGERLAVRYSNISYHLWEYDTATQRYLRSQESATQPPGLETYEPLMDRLTGEQIAADNLIILFTNTELIYKSKSTEIYDTKLTGHGEGYALRQGRIFKIQWKRAGDDKVLQIILNGIPYPLKPGNTWYILLGETSFYQKVSNGSWVFNFSIP